MWNKCNMQGCVDNSLHTLCIMAVQSNVGFFLLTWTDAVYSNVVYTNPFGWLLNVSEPRWFGDLLAAHMKKRREGAGESIRLVSVCVCVLLPLIYTSNHINYLIPTVGQAPVDPLPGWQGGKLLMTTWCERETYWKARPPAKTVKESDCRM